ncbi:MAG TPA: phasin family protein [Stellaceae bacterium]|nr:phasin family protein [Stellaceae bacterium]
MAKRPSLLNAGREAAAATRSEPQEVPTLPTKSPPAAKVTVRPPARKQRRYAASQAATTITVAPLEAPTPVRATSASKAVTPAVAQEPESSAFGWSFRIDPAGGTSLVTTVNSALMGEAGALYREMMSFADARLRHAVATAEALGRCASPAEALQAQADYAVATATEYAAQSMKLFDMTTAFARRGWASFWSGARRDNG